MKTDDFAKPICGGRTHPRIERWGHALVKRPANRRGAASRRRKLWSEGTHRERCLGGQVDRSGRTKHCDKSKHGCSWWAARERGRGVSVRELVRRLTGLHSGRHRGRRWGDSMDRQLFSAKKKKNMLKDRSNQRMFGGQREASRGRRELVMDDKGKKARYVSMRMVEFRHQYKMTIGKWRVHP